MSAITVSSYDVTSAIAISPSMTYLTESPVRLMAVIRENTMTIFSFSQPSAATVSHGMMLVATITDSSAV